MENQIKKTVIDYGRRWSYAGGEVSFLPFMAFFVPIAIAAGAAVAKKATPYVKKGIAKAKKAKKK